MKLQTLINKYIEEASNAIGYSQPTSW